MVPMEGSGGINEILERKKGRIGALNIRVDKTVPAGIAVQRRICNENCMFVKELGIACHEDNSYRGPGTAISNQEILQMVIKIHESAPMPINIHIAGDGEPTLFEEELVNLTESLRKLDFIRMIKITTNGTRLSHGAQPLAKRLKTAGIDEINVSVHSLDPMGFKEVTGIDALHVVIEGIEAAIVAGIKTSVNCLVREETFKELKSYIELSARFGIRVKFFGFLDESGRNQEYADGLLQRMRDTLMQMADAHAEYTKPYGGVLFQIENAIIDLKDLRINNCPVMDCKARDICLEGCRYHARLSPTGILQPCGVRTDNLIDMKNAKVSNKEILEKLIDGGKILESEVKWVRV